MNLGPASVGDLSRTLTLRSAPRVDGRGDHAHRGRRAELSVKSELSSSRPTH